MEAMDANTNVEQLTAAKEAEERAKAELAAAESTKPKPDQVTADAPHRALGGGGDARRRREAIIERRVGPIVETPATETSDSGHT